MALNAAPQPFTGFSDLFSPLSALLDQIKSAAIQGNVVPASVSGKSLPLYITDQGAAAYGAASNGAVAYSAPDANGNVSIASQSNGAKQLIAQLVANLTQLQVGYLSGLGFTGAPAPNPPPALTSPQNDVVNSVYSAWDAAASAYLSNDASTGDAATASLQARLGQFDTAIQTLGVTQVTPDS